MLKNLCLTALRGMRRHAVYSAINVLGLAVGFVVAMFVLLWVQDEMAYDQFLPGTEDVYRVMRTATFGADQIMTGPPITAKLDDVLDEDFADIEEAALVSWPQEMALRVGDVTFREEGYHAGPSFFRILEYRFLAGDPDAALARMDGIVLTVSTARRYFPELFLDDEEEDAQVQSVMGRIVHLENRMDLEVTGVIADPPRQTSMPTGYFLPMEEFLVRNDWVDDWGNNGLRMLVRLRAGSDAEAVSASIRNLVEERSGNEGSVLFLQPFQDIWLRSEFENGVLVGGRIDTIRLFLLVGLFVLGIAAINFMNLATARSSQRAMEVGIRKTFGSKRTYLALQFLGEAVATALVALTVAILLTALLLPAFNTLTGKHLSLLSAGYVFWSLLLGISLLTGMLAGMYPAMYLSSHSAVSVLRGGRTTTGKGAGLRRSLVVLQFGLSVLMIVGALTVNDQVRFIRETNLGLDRKDVFNARLEGPMKENYDGFRERLRSFPAIQTVSASSTNPLEVGSSTSGGVRWEGRSPDENSLFYIMQVAHDFKDVMQMELASGRDFDEARVADSTNILINESAARVMGFEDPIGQPVRVWGRDGHIIGVLKDFHQTSLHDAIEPLVMVLYPEMASQIYVRPAPGQTAGALAAFETVFREFNPTYPFQVSFVDAEFEETYRTEVIVGVLSRWFTVIAIFIASLGLFGLAAFTAARRTKEIGIRKVLGATVANVVGLLSREFMTLVVVAFVIAAPVSWVVMTRWLDGFAYHVSMDWRVLLFSVLGVLAVAGLTVGYQSVKAALANPADSIRSE